MKEPRASTIIITHPESNDVLLGRGLGASQHEGNRRFLEVVEGRKEEYNKTISYKEKAVIAKEVFEIIQSRGGRFLQLLEPNKRARKVVKRGVWQLASQKDALEKCKQALRQQRSKKPQTSSFKDVKVKPLSCVSSSPTKLEKEEKMEQKYLSDTYPSLADDFPVCSASGLLDDVDLIVPNEDEQTFTAGLLTLDGKLDFPLTQTNHAPKRRHQAQHLQKQKTIRQQVPVPVLSSTQDDTPISLSLLHDVFCSELAAESHLDISNSRHSKRRAIESSYGRPMSSLSPNIFPDHHLSFDLPRQKQVHSI